MALHFLDHDTRKVIIDNWLPKVCRSLAATDKLHIRFLVLFIVKQGRTHLHEGRPSLCRNKLCYKFTLKKLSSRSLENSQQEYILCISIFIRLAG